MKVSVIIAVKDRFPLLRNSLISWCDHDYPDYEVILVDDGSVQANKISGAAKEFESRIMRLKYIRLEHEKDRTPTVAWNEGFKHSDGDYVIFTSGDLIISHRDLIKRMLTYAGNKTRLSVVTFFMSPEMTAKLDFVSWSDNPQIIQSFPGFWEYVYTNRLLTNKDIGNSWLAGIHTYLTGQSREDWEYFGLFREDETHLVADQDVHLREVALKIWKVDTPKEICAYHQWHPVPKVEAGTSRKYSNANQARLLEEAPFE
jgi:glycosyltransferase involved in cell wall biosynthesis